MRGVSDGLGWEVAAETETAPCGAEGRLEAVSDAATRAAAKKLGEALYVLAEHGVCSHTDAMVAALTATPQGGSAERTVVLGVLRSG